MSDSADTRRFLPVRGAGSKPSFTELAQTYDSSSGKDTADGVATHQDDGATDSDDSTSTIKPDNVLVNTLTRMWQLSKSIQAQSEYCEVIRATRDSQIQREEDKQCIDAMSGLIESAALQADRCFEEIKTLNASLPSRQRLPSLSRAFVKLMRKFRAPKSDAQSWTDWVPSEQIKGYIETFLADRLTRAALGVTAILRTHAEGEAALARRAEGSSGPRGIAGELQKLHERSKTSWIQACTSMLAKQSEAEMWNDALRSRVGSGKETAVDMTQKDWFFPEKVRSDFISRVYRSVGSDTCAEQGQGELSTVVKGDRADQDVPFAPDGLTWASFGKDYPDTREYLLNLKESDALNISSREVK